MFKRFKTLISFLLIASFLIPTLNVSSQEFDPDFNKNEIISQFQMFDYNSMSESEIQSFLVSKSS